MWMFLGIDILAQYKYFAVLVSIETLIIHCNPNRDVLNASTSVTDALSYVHTT